METPNHKRENVRLQKLASQFHHELAQIILKDVFDECLQKVSLSHVRITPDLHKARVYFTHINGIEAEAEALRAFKKCKGFLRSELASRISLKYTPELEFFYDDAETLFKNVKDIFSQLDSEKKSHETPKDEK